MNREAFPNLLNSVAPLVDSALREWALPAESQAVPNLDEGVRYVLGLEIEDPARRGKRVRPALAVLTCEALGGRREHVLPFAVAVELMHNFFLVHDDIEDGDTMRHGRPTAWQRFGQAHAINIGDYLLARANALALQSTEAGASPHTALALLDLLARTLDHTIRGQALDMNARSAREIALDEYLRMVSEKTGHYLAAPIIGGAIVAGADEALLAAIREFGAAAGPMYQIMDDLIDLTESKGRGERGADIREGKRSFLAVFALAKLGASDRKELLDILDRPRESTSAGDVARAADLFERCGAFEAARSAVADFAQRAQAATARMPAPLRDLLLAVTDYLAHRTR